MEPTRTSVYADAANDQLSHADRELWELARKRSGFKWSFASYIVVNAMLIGTWYFTSGYDSYFWPVWPMLGWGVGIVMHYLAAYHSNNIFSTEQEYIKLKNQRKN